MPVKTCTKCKVEKNFSDFHNHRGGKDGLASHCKACKKEYGRKHAKEAYYRDIEKSREKDRAWKKKHPDIGSGD